jgi:hypothetical protein
LAPSSAYLDVDILVHGIIPQLLLPEPTVFSQGKRDQIS